MCCATSSLQFDCQQLSPHRYPRIAGLNLPEIEVVDRSLLVAHVNVKREQIDRGMSATTQHLEESRQPVPRHVGDRRRSAPREVVRRFMAGVRHLGCRIETE